MEKLELKHLAPYLPYKLTGLIKEDYCGIRLEDQEIFEVEKIDGEQIGTYNRWCDTYSFLPALRRLSDIEKEIEINGEIVIPIEVLDKFRGLTTEFNVITNCNLASEGYTTAFLQDKYKTPKKWHPVPYAAYMKLFEMHFDVFGLIPMGLAIDINTL